MEAISHFADIIICIIRGHDFEYSEGCTGGWHYFSRVCKRCGEKFSHKRKCGPSCSVYLKHKNRVTN